ncbi:sulfotransferase family protein [Pseudoalteromonas sp. 2CM37A]|uniref:sulfotransferase family 2 domain-containing protein n=1 Tax=Pseudoalteromonas sp. 2CM37A TaxID=2929853 RepID=UPI0020C0C8AD|nr:sulfotransferase family 2 domain-containing protein [Pseudoalteromonas sp. 2CM37A]MCK8117564.1 sulfotransferase family protein [Pseudoalteromonas sp. 2CM37A]
MLRPNVRELQKELCEIEVISLLEGFIKNKPEKEFYLANIDLLRMYGKTRQRDKFYKLALHLVSTINNPAVFREIARFSYFIEKDDEAAKIYASKAIKINSDEPLWVYYIARLPKVYFEKLYNGVYLTSIPKNASTSLKSMMLAELHGKADVNPHSVFGNPFFKSNQLELEVGEKDLKLISTREPLSRFVSYYNKNIKEEGSLFEELLFTKKEEMYGLPLKPTFDYFVENLNMYCYVFNDVLHHVLPQTAYFNDLDIYDCVADLNDSHRLGELVSKRLGLERSITPPRKMVSKKKVSELPISDSSRKVLSRLFSDDINVLTDNSNSKSYSFKF